MLVSIGKVALSFRPDTIGSIVLGIRKISRNSVKSSSVITEATFEATYLGGLSTPSHLFHTGHYFGLITATSFTHTSLLHTFLYRSKFISTLNIGSPNYAYTIPVYGIVSKCQSPLTMATILSLSKTTP
ncbi:hypothetical protein Adt_16275 [Abeliophyllum distichum]|uniref:Uncharacterized protein n=1 Tax=Abeliophyllum distichum TaxID=126358 RepID=A0ABD1TD66_9LAMI